MVQFSTSRMELAILFMLVFTPVTAGQVTSPMTNLTRPDVTSTTTTPPTRATTSSPGWMRNGDPILNPCSKVSQFAKDVSSFSQCSIVSHSSLCRKCVDEINKVTSSYVALDNMIHDPAAVSVLNTSTCPELILSETMKDMINEYYSHARGVWIMSNCDNCYESKSQNFTDDVTKFFGDKFEFEFCVDQAVSNGSCDRCGHIYSSLNAFYEHLNTAYSGNLCLDIRAEMGRVRERWSSLGCVVAIGYDLLVLSLASAVVLLTLFIYLATRVLSRTTSRIETAVQKRMSSHRNIQVCDREAFVGEEHPSLAVEQSSSSSTSSIRDRHQYQQLN